MFFATMLVIHPTVESLDLSDPVLRPHSGMFVRPEDAAGVEVGEVDATVHAYCEIEVDEDDTFEHLHVLFFLEDVDDDSSVFDVHDEMIELEPNRPTPEIHSLTVVVPFSSEKAGRWRLLGYAGNPLEDVTTYRRAAWKYIYVS